MKILCFGDSNTYGYNTVTGGRFDKQTRWTGKLQKALGPDYQIIEAGLNGRMTAFEDPYTPGRCGMRDIKDLIEAHDPIDVLVVMLGTNDCKNLIRVSAAEISYGVEIIIKEAMKGAKKPFQTLVISPVAISEDVLTSGFDWEFDRCSIEIAAKLPQQLQKVAARQDALFLDAAQVAEASKVDGIHLDESGHEKLAKAVEEILLGLL